MILLGWCSGARQTDLERTDRDRPCGCQACWYVNEPPAHVPPCLDKAVWDLGKLDLKRMLLFGAAAAVIMVMWDKLKRKGRWPAVNG
jgi:hypothetical protein